VCEANPEASSTRVNSRDQTCEFTRVVSIAQFLLKHFMIKETFEIIAKFLSTHVVF